MSKQFIAVDIDDVLADHVAAFVDFSNSKYGTDLGKHNYDDRWSNLWAVDKTEIERRALEFHTPESILDYKLINAAQTALEELSRYYNLAIVSARPQHVLDATKTWLDNHFGAIFCQVHFVPYWDVVNRRSKAEICNEIGAEYLIDDIVKHCNIAADCGVKPLLFGEYSWNQTEDLHKDVLRVRDWQEVLDYFEQQRNRK
jgi:5'(3')-deoxyribonucleotidase